MGIYNSEGLDKSYNQIRELYNYVVSEGESKVKE